ERYALAPAMTSACSMVSCPGVLWQGPPQGKKGAGWVPLSKTVTSEDSSFLDLEALRRTPLVPVPFPFVVVPGFLPGPARNALSQGFPRIDKPGSFPVADLAITSVFRDFVAEL